MYAAGLGPMARARASRLFLQPGVEVLEVRLQVLPIRLLRDPIHPYRTHTWLDIHMRSAHAYPDR